MWRWLVIDYPHKSFCNCHSQGVALSIEPLYTCNLGNYASKFLAISMFMSLKKKFAFSLEFVSRRKKKWFLAITLHEHMQTLLY
jgi:hypothetical protein